MIKAAMTKTDLEKWGAKIKDGRMKLGLKQSEFAKLINISPRSLASVEGGGNTNTRYYIDAFNLLKKKRIF